MRKYIKSARDPDWSAIDARYKAGKTLTNLHVEYVSLTDKPYSYPTFVTRHTVWVAAGSPDLWTLKAAGSPRAAGSPTAPMTIVAGLLYIQTHGAALQTRRGSLCIRFPDGSERRFRPGAHGIRAIILTTSASITTEALLWTSREHIASMVLSRAECLVAFGDGVAVRHGRAELKLRERQFAAFLDPKRRAKVAADIVTLKIAKFELSPDDAARYRSALKTVRVVQDAVLVEAKATYAYWTRWRGFPLTFKGDAPSAWLVYPGRVNARRGGRLGEKSAVFSNRGAMHPVNAILNYAYAVALGLVTRVLAGLGLDPCFGFLHSTKPGRLSLSYDVLELLRPQIDNAMFGFAKMRRFQASEFEKDKTGVVRLGAALAREVAERTLKAVPPIDAVASVKKVAKLL